MSYRFLLVLLATLYLASPAIAVSRLFVDEITGYSNEDVFGVVFQTDLLIVNSETVENGVIATGGSRPHFVETPGKVHLNGDHLDFSSAHTLDITSYGENVAFDGNEGTVNFGANGDFTIDSIDVSLNSYASITGTIGGVFSTYGVDAEIRSIGDFIVNSDADILLASEDRITFTSNAFSLASLNAIVISSIESNIFSNAFQGNFIETVGPLDIYAESGIEIGSSHGTLEIVAEVLDITAGNVIIASADATLFEISGDVTFQATSAVGDIWASSERIRIDRGDANVLLSTTSKTDGVVALSTTGTIQSFSDAFATESNSLVFFSIDNISLKPVNDFVQTGSRSWSILASAGVEYFSKDTKITAQTGNINFEVFGKSYVNTVFNNIILNAATDYNFLSGQTLFQGSQLLDINANDVIIDSTEYVHFKSATDILFTSIGIQCNSTDLFFIQSNEHTTINSEDTYIGALRDLQVYSSGDISFVNSIDITQETLGNLKYFINREIDIESSDSSVQSTSTFINAQESITSNSVATSNLDVNDLEINAFTDFTFKAGGDFTVTVPAIVFSTDLSGGIEFYTSKDGNIDISSTTFILTSKGNADFTSTEDTTMTSNVHSVVGNDIINSANMEIVYANINVGSSIVLSADNIYSNLPTTLDIKQAINIVGKEGVSISTGTIHQKEVDITTTDLIDTHQSVTILGGAVTLDIAEEFVLGIDTTSTQLQDVTYSVGNEKDMIFHSGTSIVFNTVEDVTVYNGNIGTYAETFNADATDVTFRANERFDITALDSITITAPYMDLTEFKQINSFSEADTTISTSNLQSDGFLVDLFATNQIDIFAFSYLLSTNEAHFYHDDWTLKESVSIDFKATDISYYFEDISLDQPAFRIHSNHLEMNSVNRIQFQTDEQDISVTTATVEVTTPLLTMIAHNKFAFTGGDVTLGSTVSTPANRNLYNVLFSVDGTLEQDTFGLYSLKAVGNDEFEHYGIWFETLGDTSFEALGNYEARADNGIDSQSTSYTSFSEVDTTFSVVDGSFRVTAQQPLLNNGENKIAYIANGGDFVADAIKGQMIFIAGADIISKAADYTYTSTKQLSFSTTTEHAALTGSITFDSAGDQSWEADQALHIIAGSGAIGETVADISGKIGTSTTFTIGKDILMRALGNEIPGAVGGNQILFESGQLTPPVVDSFKVTVKNGPISFFTSGEHTLTGVSDTLYKSTAGDISFGSKSNEFDVTTIGSFIGDAGDTLYTEAHGIYGNIEYDISDDGRFTVGNNYTNVALGSIKLKNTGATVTTSNLLLFDTNYHEGSISTFGSTILYESVLHDIILTGKNLQSVNFGSLTIDSPIVNFGKDNVYTPQFTANLSDMDITSIGDISISASNSNITLYSMSGTTFTSSNNVVITSGGIIDFAATGPLSSSSLLVQSAVMTFTAADAVEKVIEGNGMVTAGTALATTSTISLLSKGSKTANGFIVESENSVGIDVPVGEFQQKIATSTSINTGSTSISFTTQLTSSSSTVTMVSDNKLTFNAASALIETTQQSARIEFVTEGENSNIEWGVRGATTLSSNDDLFFISDSFHQTATGKASITASGANSGKVQIDASDNIEFESSKDISITSQDDVYIAAEGEDTIIAFYSTSTITTDANELSYTTDADEGGSIFINIESLSTLPTLSITTADWTIDIDGDINTNSHYFTWNSDEHQMAVYGYIDIASEDTLSILYAEDGIITAEQADVHFESSGGSIFSFVDLLTTGTQLEVSVRGNQTTTSNNYLSFSSAKVDFEASNGQLTWSAYDDITVSSGQSKFQSDHAVPTDYGIDAFTTYPGADINFQSAEDFTAYGNNVFISATATEPEAGYVKFLKDDTQSSRFGASTLQVNAGEQVEIISEYGNIRYEYSTNLEIIGGDIHGIAGRAIEFNVRGDGAPIITDPFAAVQGKYAISWEHLNEVQFETENNGDILVESEQGSINIVASLLLARSDYDNLYLESTGNIAVYTTRDDMYAGLEFKSTGNIELYTYDDAIVATCEDLVIIAPAFNSLIQFYTEADGKIDYEIDGPAGSQSIFFAISELSFLAYDGDLHLSATCDDCDNSISFNTLATVIQSPSNIYYQYYNNLVFNAGANTITISTEPEVTYTPDANYDGIITFAGKRNSVFNAGDDNTGPDSQVPRVIFPPVIRFLNMPTYKGTVIQGGFCPVDRQVGFGRSSEFPQNNESPLSAGVINSDFCICSDNVWACIPSPPVGGFFYSSYSYESYNSDVTSVPDFVQPPLGR